MPIENAQPTPGARWRRNLLSPQEQVELFPPGDLNANVDHLPQTYKEIRLLGTMRDAVGNRQQVDERFLDLPEWRDVVHAAHERWTAPEVERRVADAMYRKFERPLGDLTRATQEVARAVHSLAPPRDNDSE
jgi:hypothetical protein